MVFNQKALAALKPPTSGQAYYRDAKTPGLGYRLTSGGGAAYVWEGRAQGRSRRIVLGKPATMSLVEARAAALETATAVSKGKDPAADRAAAKGEPTFGDLATKYIDHVKLHKRSWQREDGRMLRDVIGKSTDVPALVPKTWTHRKLGEISHEVVANLHARIGQDHGRFAANRCLAMISTMFNFARLDNPARGIKKFKEEKRERFLAPAELKRVFAAIEAEPSLTWKSFFTLSLLLGQRRNELVSARWADIDLDTRVWSIPTTKSGRSHLVPLPDAACSILKTLRKAQGKNIGTWVFPSADGSASGHIAEPRKPWQRICEAADIKDVRIHDLRRTLGSWMAASGHGLPIIGKILGHSQASTTQIYARVILDPQREALEATTRKMLGQ